MRATLAWFSVPLVLVLANICNGCEFTARGIGWGEVRGPDA